MNVIKRIVHYLTGDLLLLSYQLDQRKLVRR